MTVNIIIKIYDGIVLASDSAGTMNASTEYVHTRNNMNKLFRLSKDHNMAIIMSGASHVGSISIGNLIKDFNSERPICNTSEEIINAFSMYVKTAVDDYVKPVINNYLKDIDNNTESELEADHDNANQSISNSMVNFYFAAYDNDSSSFRVWNFKTYSNIDDFITLSNEDLFPVVEVEKLKDKTGWIADGIHEPVDRLINGYENNLRENLLEIVSADKKESLDEILKNQHLDMVYPYMSIQDAIDLARFLAKMSAKSLYFLPLPNYIGGSIDIATITKHEGFKWIKRKLYYNAEYN